MKKEKPERVPCTALIAGKGKNSEPRACVNAATEWYRGVPYCGVHVQSAAKRAWDAELELRAQSKRASLMAFMRRYDEWTAAHPSVWDPMPTGAARASGPASDQS